MKNLRELIKASSFKTQERFAIASNINEGLLSKYCRGLRKLSKRHSEIIRRLLGDGTHNS